MEFLFIASMEKKSEGKSICHHFSIPIRPLSSRKAVKTSTIEFPPKKGFITYVFGRNWAVRNPVATRLDSSSLVNKQAARSSQFYLLKELNQGCPVYFKIYQKNCSKFQKKNISNHYPSFSPSLPFPCVSLCSLSFSSS